MKWSTAYSVNQVGYHLQHNSSKNDVNYHLMSNQVDYHLMSNQVDLMHSKIIIQNHSTLAVLSSQLDVLCANPMKIKIPKRGMPLMVGSLPPCEFLHNKIAALITRVLPLLHKKWLGFPFVI